MKIYYFSVTKSSFIEKDLLILKKKYNIEVYLFGHKKYKIPLKYISQFIYLCKSLNKKCIYVSMFAGHHSFLPTLFSKVFRKKHVVFLGGTECNYIPHVNYGNKNKVIYNYVTKFTLKNTTLLLPVNKELIFCNYTYCDEAPKHQGYLAIYPKIKTENKVIWNGFDSKIFNIKNKNRKLSFITIASGLESERRQKVKGIDLFLYLAKKFTDYDFTIVGSNLAINYPNLSIVPFVENKELPNILNQHSHYIQLSLTEGFPNSLAEAMLCGCIPIVSRVGAMPDIVGEFGYVLETKNLEKLESLFLKVINEYDNKKESIFEISERIEKKYSIQKREEQILQTIKSLSI